MAKNQYVEEVLIKVKADKTELEKIEKSFDDLKIKDLLSDEAKKSLEDEYKKVREQVKQLQKIEEEIADIKKLGGKAAEEAVDKLKKAASKIRKDLAKEGYDEEGTSFKYSFQQALKEGLVDAGKKAWDTIKDFAKETFTEALSMMQEIAAYSINSMMFSSKATQLRMSYGLSGSQAYAAAMASEQTGFSSFEDFVQNQAFATEETKRHWKELFEKYQQTYEQDREIALEVQRFTVEWADFKKELSMEVINFFMENKDMIKEVLSTGITFMKGMLEAVGWIVRLLDRNGIRSDNDRSSATSDILSSYVNNNSRNISINNVFNGVQASDRTQLLNAGSLTFEQIIQALR